MFFRWIVPAATLAVAAIAGIIVWRAHNIPVPPVVPQTGQTTVPAMSATTLRAAPSVRGSEPTAVTARQTQPSAVSRESAPNTLPTATVTQPTATETQPTETRPAPSADVTGGAPAETTVSAPAETTVSAPAPSVPSSTVGEERYILLYGQKYYPSDDDTVIPEGGMGTFLGTVQHIAADTDAVPIGSPQADMSGAAVYLFSPSLNSNSPVVDLLRNDKIILVDSNHQYFVYTRR